MMRELQRLDIYIDHILEAIKRIEEYSLDMDESSFVSNSLVQDAVIRNLEIIGEASKNIEKHFPEFAAEHPELPLAAAYQMRNALAHGYFKVDFAIIWKTIQLELPSLCTKIEAARPKG